MEKLASKRRAGKSSVTTNPRVDSYMSTPSGNKTKRTTLPAKTGAGGGLRLRNQGGGK